tara:strand:- start:346 stop:816 length:471 start_codon:yes stop_codon:yes gene_type:complete
VFKQDGTFVQELFVKPNSLGDGSVWDISFSNDPEQRFIYLADGTNRKIFIIERSTMEILTNFGDGGRNPGQFFAVHNIATDSKGNIYTTETYEGKRVQKFKYMGMGPVTVMDQGTLWPADRRLNTPEPIANNDYGTPTQRSSNNFDENLVSEEFAY